MTYSIVVRIHTICHIILFVNRYYKKIFPVFTLKITCSHTKTGLLLVLFDESIAFAVSMLSARYTANKKWAGLDLNPALSPLKNEFFEFIRVPAFRLRGHVRAIADSHYSFFMQT